jgi:hypothetical protein
VRAYLLTSGVAFALLFLAHISRVIQEGVQLFKGPLFVLTTLASAAMFAWALALLLRKSRSM